jgi:N-methylhydantoinase A
MNHDEGFVVGVDIGGTFTDCVCATPVGRTHIGKSPSTPTAFEDGFIGSLESVARQLGLSTQGFVQETRAIYHGCTVGTNALVEGRTPKVGLIATAGHSESLSFMQGGGRLLNMPAEYVAHVAGHDKPPPLVDPNLVREVPERVSASGEILVPLEMEAARAAIGQLMDQGVEAFAVSLLWSVTNPAHERAIEQLIREMTPESYVSVSHRVVPKRGEFQRTVATVINSLVGPVMTSYLGHLRRALDVLGFAGAFDVMSCSGGLISPAEAEERPILTIGSGPAAGLVGAQALGPHSGSKGGLLTLDIGGTTADIGVMPGSTPLMKSSNWFGQYEYFVPRLDVRSIGVGGGSLVRFESSQRTLKVGPLSAGAEPGPVAYGKRGTEPTVTDANLVVGLLNPEYFLDGRLSLDKAAAEEALERVGRPLGMSALETAAAVIKIADCQMADSIRLASIGEGVDPRSFALCAYGGAGALHAAAIAEELGMREVVIPLGDLAAGWSAFGVARSNALAIDERPIATRAPFALDAMLATWQSLEDSIRERLAQRGIIDAQIRRWATLKYELQVSELTVEVPADLFAALSSEALVETFAAEYERLYGEGTGYAAAGVAVTAVSVTAAASRHRWPTSQPDLPPDTEPSSAETRQVVWYNLGTKPLETAIHDGRSLRPRSRVKGPALIELPYTTIAIRPHDVAKVSPKGNVHIYVKGVEAA